MDFCVTNSEYVRVKQFNHKVSLGKDYYLYFNEKKYYRETDNHIMFFCGILWYQNPEILYEENYNTDILNGQFRAIIFDKKNSLLRVITDFIEDFPIYYYQDNDNLIISSSLMSFSPNYFTLSKKWIYEAAHHRIHHAYYPNLLDLPVNNNTYYDENITPIHKVNRIGLGRIVYFLNNNIVDNIRYYKPETDFYNLFHVEKKYNYEQALELSKICLENNYNKIINTFDEISIFASNGIDSLLNVYYLKDHPNVNVISYGYDWSQGQNNTLQKLHSEYLKIPTKFFTFDREQYINIIYEAMKNSSVPIKQIYTSIGTYISKKNTFKDVVITGSFGDRIFGHETGNSMSYGIHYENIDNFDDLKEYTSKHYSSFADDYSERYYDQINSLTFIEHIASFYHYHHFSLAKFDRIFFDKLIIDPYVDSKLRSLLPQCNLEAQKYTILDAQLQIDLIKDKELLSYLAPVKIGADEGLNFEFSFVNKDKAYELLRELSELKIPTSFQQAFIKMFNKDKLVPRDLQLFGLGFFIKNWITNGLLHK